MLLHKDKPNNYPIILGLYITLNFSYVMGMVDLTILSPIYYSGMGFMVLLSLLVIIQRMKIYIDKIFIFMCLFSTYTILTISYSESILYADIKLVSVLKIFIIFFVTRMLVNTKDEVFIFELFKIFMIVNIFIILIYSISNFSTIINSISQGMRLRAGGINTIWLSRFVCETILVMILLVDKKIIKSGKTLLLALLVPLFVLAIASGSKGPLISLMSAYIVYMYFNNKQFKLKNKYYSTKKVAQFLLYGFIMLFLINIANIFFPNNFLSERFSMDSILDDSSGSRLYRITESLEMLSINSLFFGHGLGSWAILYNGIDQRVYPHNIIVELLVETGILGCMLFLIPIYLCFKKIPKGNIAYLIILTLLIYNLINSLFSGDLGTSNIGIFAYLAMLSFRRNKNEIESL